MSIKGFFATQLILEGFPLIEGEGLMLMARIMKPSSSLKFKISNLARKREVVKDLFCIPKNRSNKKNLKFT